MEHRPGGKTEVVLTVAEKAVVQEISLHPPAQRAQQAVINSTAQRVGERGIGSGKRLRLGAFAEVSRPKQDMRERPHPADRERELRAHQKMVLSDVHGL